MEIDCQYIVKGKNTSLLVVLGLSGCATCVVHWLKRSKHKKKVLSYWPGNVLLCGAVKFPTSWIIVNSLRLSSSICFSYSFSPRGFSHLVCLEQSFQNQQRFFPQSGPRLPRKGGLCSLPVEPRSGLFVLWNQMNQPVCSACSLLHVLVSPWHTF